MFDSLLGKKFTNKCKHSIKCIKTRLVPIRKKKQVMLRYLRKDIADLVAKGHQINAFGRIEALIVEINHASCYDVIEKYCQFILDQLPSLQKQRECPQESEEAVSTIIFAAARFSDLPELCDLRRAFTERYDGHFEKSVNEEFVGKIQKKSFSTEMKLLFMEDIAREFSIAWDWQAFKEEISDSPSPVLDRPKKGMDVSNGKNGPHTLTNSGRKEADTDARNGEIRRNVIAEAIPMIVEHKLVQDVPRDIHVISSISHSHPDVGVEKKARKAFGNEPESVEPCPRKSEIPPYSKPKGVQNGKQNDDPIIEEIPRSRPQQTVRNPGLIGKASKAEEGLDSKVHERHRYSKPKGVQNGKQNDDPIIEEIRRSRPQRTLGDPDLTGIAREAEGLGPKAHERHPYSKLKGVQNGKQNDDPIIEEIRRSKPQRTLGDPDLTGIASEAKEGLDPKADERHPVKPLNSNNDRPGYIVPPYVKPKAKNLSPHERLNSENDADRQLKDGVAGNEKPRPVSVRRKHAKLAAGELNSAIDDPKIVNQNANGRRRQGGEEEKIWSRAPNGQKKHEDEEESIMDQLLDHYSKKGTENKTSRAVSLPPEPVSPKEAVKGPARAASMQPEMLGGGRVHPRLPDYDDLAARFIAMRRA